MGADDLTLESRRNQVRHPSDMIDVGVGKKQKVYFPRRNRELVKTRFRIMAVCRTAVHQNIDICTHLPP